MMIHNNALKLFEFTKTAITVSRNISSGQPLLFKLTSVSCAEPLKKKKRVDPVVLKAREDRKRRRLEKQIRVLERNVLQPKTLTEMELPSDLKSTLRTRTRPTDAISRAEKDNRDVILETWTKFKKQQVENDVKMLKRILFTKETALKALREESEELYVEAIQVDPLLLPFTGKGPRLTPPIKNFNPLDGEHNDKTRNWDKLLSTPAS